MERTVGGEEAVGGPVAAASDVRDFAFGLFENQYSRGDVVGLERELPVTVETARRDVAQIERGGTAAPDVLHPAGDLRQVFKVVGPHPGADAAEPGRQQRAWEFSGRRNAEPPAVPKRPLSGFRMEKFAQLRRADRPGNGSPTVLQCDRHRVVRETVHEAGRAVDRVDDPAILRRVAGMPGFFAEDAVAGVAAADFRADELLDPTVDRCDQIGGAALGMDFRLRQGPAPLRRQLSGGGSQFSDEVDHGQRR